MQESNASMEQGSPIGPTASGVDRTHARRRPTLARWIRRALLASATLVIVGTLIVAWWPKPVVVDVAQIAAAPLRVTVDEEGQARVKDRFVISAPLTGSVARIELDPGDRLTQSQILARIVPVLPPLLDERTRTGARAQVAAAEAAKSQTLAQIERANAALTFAKDEAARQELLLQQGTTSRAQAEQARLNERTATAELESARFAERVAQYEIQMARATLQRLSAFDAKQRGEQLDLPSPINGRVLKVFRESEGVVQASTPLLEVGDPSALEIVVDVLTSDAVRIAVGAAVHVDRWGGGPLEGRVRLVEPSAFTRVSALGVEEQRVNVIVDLTSPISAWSALGDGYRVETQIVVWEEAQVIQAPISAVFRRGDGWAVYAIEADRARLKSVEVGQRADNFVQISSGLALGEHVIVHPSDQVAEGVRVARR
jgi:HlyD family secretion protein